MKVTFYTVHTEGDYQLSYGGYSISYTADSWDSYIKSSPRTKFWPWYVPNVLAIL